MNEKTAEKTSLEIIRFISGPLAFMMLGPIRHN